MIVRLLYRCSPSLNLTYGSLVPEVREGGGMYVGECGCVGECRCMGEREECEGVLGVWESVRRVWGGV